MSCPRHWIAVTVFAAWCAGAALTGCGGNEAGVVAFPDSLVDGEVVAVINGDDITGRQLKIFTLVYQPNVADSLNSRLFNLDILNGFIDRTLLYQEAMAAGVAVDDSTHHWFVNRFTQAFGGEGKMEAMLSRYQITRPEFEQVIKRDLVIRRFIETQVGTDIDVGEDDARAYYDNNPDRFQTGEAVHARHIIVRTLPADTDSARAEKRSRIEAVLAKARAGENFQQLARQHSEGPSAPNGGDLGFFERQEMVKPFSDAAFDLEPGEISDVVETQFGFHIIQVVERRPADTMPYEEVRDQLVSGLYDRELAGVLENHLKRTRSVAIIEPKFDIGGLTQRESTTFTR